MRVFAYCGRVILGTIDYMRMFLKSPNVFFICFYLCTIDFTVSFCKHVLFTNFSSCYSQLGRMSDFGQDNLCPASLYHC